MRIPLDALDQEFDLTKQAFFTDPEDQSAYFYHRWLVQSLMDHASSDDQNPEPLDNQKACSWNLTFWSIWWTST